MRRGRLATSPKSVPPFFNPSLNRVSSKDTEKGEGVLGAERATGPGRGQAVREGFAEVTSELNFEEQVASTQHKHQEGWPRRGNGRQKHSAAGKELMAQCGWSNGSKTDVAEGSGLCPHPNGEVPTWAGGKGKKEVHGSPGSPPLWE